MWSTRLGVGMNCQQGSAPGAAPTIGDPVKLGKMVTTGGSSAADFVVTTTADSPAGSLILCALSWELGDAATFIASATDDAGNTYVVETFAHNSNFHSNVQWLWVANAAHLPIGGKITAVLHVGGSAGYRGMACYSVTNIKTINPRDFLGNDVSDAGATPTVTTGALPQASMLIFAMTQPFVGPTYTESAGFTTQDTLLDTNNRLDTASKKVTSAASVTYQPTITLGEYAASAISFKGA